MSGRPLDRRNAEDRGGFSLLEVVISMVIMAFGVLGLAGTTLYTVREVTWSDMTSKRADATQSAIELVRSQPFDSMGTGSRSVGPYSVAWATANGGRYDRVVTLITTGPGITSTATGPVFTASAVDTVSYRVIAP